MDIFKEIINWLVVGTGLFGWLVFLPQIRLFLKVKESRSNSLGLLWGSVVIQVIILFHVILENDWQLTFAYVINLFFVGLLLFLTYYYRWWPGGRNSTHL